MRIAIHAYLTVGDGRYLPYGLFTCLIELDECPLPEKRELQILTLQATGTKYPKMQADSTAGW